MFVGLALQKGSGIERRRLPLRIYPHLHSMVQSLPEGDGAGRSTVGTQKDWSLQFDSDPTASLGDDLLRYILLHPSLDDESVGRACCVCRRFRRVAGVAAAAVRGLADERDDEVAWAVRTSQEKN